MPRPPRDFTGLIFGRLTVIEPTSGRSGRNVVWRCRCECGNETLVSSGELGRETKSCGCWNKVRAVTHGETLAKHPTPEYTAWRNMRVRCGNPKNTAYAYYGGRGITVCDRWQVFEHFLADMGRRPKGTSLDRIDNDRGYSKDNCRWATKIQQHRNRSDNRMVTWRGETRCVSEWAERLGFNQFTVIRRLERGWSIDRAFGVTE